ncbi:conserved hypothetical protein [Candidatus Sulfopaludibacter sp. SbA3]|nr:conserved hypothetical protein [Candidatus Sulfopaludibacter sp. SbA3]
MPFTHVILALFFLQSPKPGSVSGTVTNSVTGAPVRKAHITLRAGDASYTATSDASGAFVISGVNPGAYFASADCAGFQPLGTPGVRPEPIRVAEDQRVENVPIRLRPLGVITGRVLDENGDPMAQISVQALVETYGRDGRRMTNSGMANTDDRGEYRLFDIPAGRYYLMATNPSLLVSPNGRLHAAQGETAYVTTWFPGVTEPSQAAANELAAGGELGGIDIRMRRTRVYHIRGKALAPGSQQRIDGTVWLSMCDPSDLMPGASGLYAPILQDGSFDAFGIVPGTWCAIINQMNDNTHGVYANQTVTVADRDIENVTLTALPTAEIKGQVLVDGATPTNVQPMPIRLMPAEEHGRGVGSGSLHPDGTFTIQNVQPDTYRVVALNLYGMYLKGVRFNGRDMPGGRIQVPSAGGPLTLLFATDAGELGGTVQTASGEPAANVYVTAVSPSSLSDSPGAVLTTAEGTFLMRGLAPGDYSVLAWDTREFGLTEYAEFRKQFESRAAAVTVHSKGHETVSLKVVTAAEMEAAKARLR